MAKNESINGIDPIAFSAIQQGGGGSNPLVNEYFALQVKQLKRLEEERERQELEDLEKREKRLIAQKQDAHRQEQERLAIIASQNGCSHRTGNITLVRGQGLGEGRARAICQFCLKEWDSFGGPNGVPAHLQPPIDQWGGPKF